jgi:hypothetical protein
MLFYLPRYLLLLTFYLPTYMQRFQDNVITLHYTKYYLYAAFVRFGLTPVL